MKRFASLRGMFGYQATSKDRRAAKSRIRSISAAEISPFLASSVAVFRRSYSAAPLRTLSAAVSKPSSSVAAARSGPRVSILVAAHPPLELSDRLRERAVELVLRHEEQARRQARWKPLRLGLALAAMISPETPAVLVRDSKSQDTFIITRWDVV